MSKNELVAEILALPLDERVRLVDAIKLPLVQKDGIWVFDLPPDTPRVTARQVQQLLDKST